MRNSGRPRRPVERAVEQAEAAGADLATCPHADIAARLGRAACRLCGAEAQLGRLGYAGTCSWFARTAPAGDEGVGGVHAQDPDQQVLPPGALAQPGRDEGAALAPRVGGY